MCDVKLIQISQNSLHVISIFRILMMAIQIKAFRRNNGVRCVIVGVASFTYVKEANDTKKSVHSPTPAPLRLALAEQRICNVCVAVAYLSHDFWHSQFNAPERNRDLEAREKKSGKLSESSIYTHI